jgi:hypothetical protein
VCLHESMGLSQDGSQEILCWGCGRSFGHLMRDRAETFIAHMEPDAHVAVIVPSAPSAAVGVAVVDGRLQASYIYPCKVCGWAGTCGEYGEDCHT